MRRTGVIVRGETCRTKGCHNATDGEHKYCIVCRFDAALRMLGKRADRKRQLVCTECGGKRFFSRELGRYLRFCKHHRDYHKKWLEDRYYKRRKQGLCITCGEPAPLGGLSELGFKHKAECDSCAGR